MLKKNYEKIFFPLKALIVLFLLVFSNLAVGQTIQLNQLKGKKKILTIAEGDRIHVVYQDSVNINGKFLLHPREKGKMVVFGTIEKIDSTGVTLRKKKELIKVDLDQILKLRKGLVGYYYLSLGTLSVGSVVFLSAKDALFLGPVLFAYLAVVVSNRVLWDKVLNPLKRTSPESWKRKNSWEISYIGQSLQ